MSIEYIPGYKGHMGGSNGKITRVVMHSTVSPCEAGVRYNVAKYFQDPNSGGLAHYIVDPAGIVQCAPENQWVWHAPPNPGSLGIELCDPSEGSADRWKDDNHRTMLDIAANKVAAMLDVYHLPLAWLSVQDLLDGKSGVTSHNNVSLAFKQSDHTDPGEYLWHDFMYDRPNSVKKYLAERSK